MIMSRFDVKETVNINVGGLFTTLLAVAFIILKLCHVIEWSWLWVLSPLWIPLVLTIAIAIFVAVFTSIIER